MLTPDSERTGAGAGAWMEGPPGPGCWILSVAVEAAPELERVIVTQLVAWLLSGATESRRSVRPVVSMMGTRDLGTGLTTSCPLSDSDELFTET